MTVSWIGGKPVVIYDQGPMPEWTPEAIAAAGGSMEPLRGDELRRAHAFATPYQLAGEEPSDKSPDVARVLDVVNRRLLICKSLKGLVLECESPSDRWYITFRRVRRYRQRIHVFQEASGGEGELFHADEFEDFMKRFDIPTRQTRIEIRNGFRVAVYSAAD